MAELFKKNANTGIKTLPENGKTFTLQELYKLLDCTMVEFIYLNEFYIMIIDEEGKLNSKEVNDIATYHFRKYMKSHDFIVGDALVCNRSEVN